jgi:hypothetical protein
MNIVSWCVPFTLLLIEVVGLSCSAFLVDRIWINRRSWNHVDGEGIRVL